MCLDASILVLTLLCAGATGDIVGDGPHTLRIADYDVSQTRSPMHGAFYPERSGMRLISGNRESADNGETWKPFAPTPDFTADLPYGFRRNPVTSVVDPNSGRLITIVNALDTPGLDPKRVEPRIALSRYYLRYRVSEDGGRTWLFDEPIVHTGDFTTRRPFDGIEIGKNCFFLGDAGNIPIVTRGGKILVPVQATMLDEDGSLYNPTGQNTYTDVFVIIGTWDEGGRIEWTASHRVRGDAERSTRGMIEPTLAEFADGRILMVMRGSNAGNSKLPSRRWFSVSKDGGKTWTAPEPWTYDDGRPFFSPSSMSTLIRHSSGRVFWVGNLSERNCRGNGPRWPVVAGEVDPRTLTLKRDSVITVDTRREEDADRGRLDLSHFRLREDRRSGELVLTYPRAHGGYESREWAVVRIAVE